MGVLHVLPVRIRNLQQYPYHTDFASSSNSDAKRRGQKGQRGHTQEKQSEKRRRGQEKGQRRGNQRRQRRGHTLISD